MISVVGIYTRWNLIFAEVFVELQLFPLLMRAHFSLIRVPDVFHALHHFGFEGIAFFKKLSDALRIRTFQIGQALQVAGLPAKFGPPSRAIQIDGFDSLALSARRYARTKNARGIAGRSFAPGCAASSSLLRDFDRLRSRLGL